MLGTQGWRAEGLIKPSEPFLNQSVFADFVGNYKQIPSSISRRNFMDKWFIPTIFSAELDRKLIGYYAGKIALALPSTSEIKRHKLWRKIALIKRTSMGYLGQSGRVFSKSPFSQWPITLFKISDTGVGITNNKEAILDQHNTANRPNLN
jgi:hypothetical protein